MTGTRFAQLCKGMSRMCDDLAEKAKQYGRQSVDIAAFCEPEIVATILKFALTVEGLQRE